MLKTKTIILAFLNYCIILLIIFKSQKRKEKENEIYANAAYVSNQMKLLENLDTTVIFNNN